MTNTFEVYDTVWSTTHSSEPIKRSRRAVPIPTALLTELTQAIHYLSEAERNSKKAVDLLWSIAITYDIDLRTPCDAEIKSQSRGGIVLDDE